MTPSKKVELETDYSIGSWHWATPHASGMPANWLTHRLMTPCPRSKPQSRGFGIVIVKEPWLNCSDVLIRPLKQRSAGLSEFKTRLS